MKTLNIKFLVVIIFILNINLLFSNIVNDFKSLKSDLKLKYIGVDLSIDNYIINDEKVKEFYDTKKFILNLSVEMYTVYNISISYGIKDYKDSSLTTFYHDSTELRVKRRDLNIKYYFFNKSFLIPYVGIGMVFYHITESVDSTRLLNTDKKGNGIEFCFGTYFKFKNFENIVFFVQLMYNSIKPVINNVNFNFGGIEYLVGFKFRI